MKLLFDCLLSFSWSGDYFFFFLFVCQVWIKSNAVCRFDWNKNSVNMVLMHANYIFATKLVMNIIVIFACCFFFLFYFIFLCVLCAETENMVFCAQTHYTIFHLLDWNWKEKKSSNLFEYFVIWSGYSVDTYYIVHTNTALVAFEWIKLWWSRNIYYYYYYSRINYWLSITFYIIFFSIRMLYEMIKMPFISSLSKSKTCLYDLKVLNVSFCLNIYLF